MIRVAARRTVLIASEAAAMRIRAIAEVRQKEGFEIRGFSDALRKLVVGGKDYAEEKGVKAVTGPRANTAAQWLRSLLCLNAQLANWRGRGERWQYMSTAAVEAAESTSTDGIIITDSCIRRLKEIQLEDGAAGRNKMLRVSVEGGGCSGFLYNFSLDDQQKSDDRLFEKDGVTVVVDEISLSFVKGSTIDFSEELIRASFTVATNPNAASGCGCGASFTAK